MVIKSKIFIKCNAKEFDSLDVCKNWISNSNVNCIFLVGYMKFYWRWEKVCWPWASYQHLPAPDSQWHVNVTVGCKNCCIISKMNKTHLIWGSIHVIYIEKKKYWAQHRALWKTQCNVCDRGTAVFGWDVLFSVTQIRLKQVLHDTLLYLRGSLTFKLAVLVIFGNFNCYWLW